MSLLNFIMSKNRVFGRPMPDASVPRNAFDLSKQVHLNMPFGAIIPCYAHQALAGSRFQIGVDSFIRTAAVNTASFPRLKMETEFFAVPLRYLWSFWDNFKLGLKDYNSTALMDVTQGTPQMIVPNHVPMFNIYSLWSMFYNNSTYDDLGYYWKYGARRLADMLGYGRYNEDFEGQYNAATDVQYMSLFKAAAYQKVYFDHFRNTAYEANDPMAYNLDCLSTTQGYPVANVLPKLFKLRYVNYRKDYFQSVYPGLNFVTTSATGSQNMASVPSWIQGLMSGLATGNDFSRWINSDATSLTGSGSVTTSSAKNLFDDTHTKNIVHDHLIPNTIYNVQSIRAAFALDKLNRSSAYAPQHVKNQYEARYGIKFSNNASYESQKIGSFDTDIVIGEVTSTANTDSGTSGDALGAIGGKGVGARHNNNLISFDVKEDSIIIGVCYAMPRTSYDSYRFDNWNMKLNRNDYFIPEFMNMGLKPMYVKEVQNSFYSATQSKYSLKTSADMNNVIGFQLPYMEYKCDIDENHGLFADKNSDLGQFVVHTNSEGNDIVTTGSGVRASYFKVKPSDMDSIFVNAANGQESTDHLFGELTFTIPVNQNMSVHGMPSL